MDKQLDLICTGCPLKNCSEDSLWCVYRLVTNPNEAQKALLNDSASIRDRHEREAAYNAKYREDHREEKRQYDAEYYQQNRDRKLKRANERNARRRLTNQGHSSTGAS